MKITISKFNRVLFALLAAFSVSVIAAKAQGNSTGINGQVNCPSYPATPTASTAAADDMNQMMCQLGLSFPFVPDSLTDTNRPPSAYPASAGSPEGNWRNFYGHTITKSVWGLWNNFEDTSDGFLDIDGFNGWDKHTVNDPDSWRVFDDATAQHAQGGYTPINLLQMDDGTPILTADDWWSKRRPEIFNDAQEEYYGKIPDSSRWPNITWSLSAASTGTANGIAYMQWTVTGTISTNSGGINFVPYVPRNRPSISATLRIPRATFTNGVSVPVIITFGSINDWVYTATNNLSWGWCAFNTSAVQADSGGASMSSYIIGLINHGNWRKPDDWGALAAYAWGVSRLIDFFENPVTNGTATFLGVDQTKLGIEGLSYLGKATLVTMAYEPRLAIAYPAQGGEGGGKMVRRHWGEDLENSMGNTGEYFWFCGNAYNYCGPLNDPSYPSTGFVANAIDLPASGPYPGNTNANWRTLYPTAGASTQPGTYLPRKIELMKIDAHSILALCAPRPVFMNGGTHDSPEDFRGTWLSEVFATPVYNLLGVQGLLDKPWPVVPNPAYAQFFPGYDFSNNVYVPQNPVTIHTKTIRNFDGYILGNLAFSFRGEALATNNQGGSGFYYLSTTGVESPSTGGHTDVDDFPLFISFAKRFMTNSPSCTLSGNVLSKSGAANSRAWVVSVNNPAPGGTAYAAQIDGITFTQTSGAVTGTPHVINSFPVSLGNIPFGGSAAGTITIDFSSCPTLARFTINVHFSANNGLLGATSGTMVLNNQYR
jgi:hypothetical protein